MTKLLFYGSLESLKRAAALGSGASSYTLYLHYRAAHSPEGREHYLALKQDGIPYDELYVNEGASGAPPN